MYFDPAPKEKKEDLFNFEEEYLALKRAFKRYNLIAIKGLRRTGKTSLMRVVFNEIEKPKCFIDSRELAPYTPHQTYLYILKKIEESTTSIFEKILGRITEIEVGITLKIEREMLAKVLENINKKSEFYLFIDEVQLLKRARLDEFLAYIVDRYKNIKIVISGSEIGLLDEFLGEEDASPLFGRAKKIIDIKRLTPPQSKQFLQKGFEQAGIKISKEEIAQAVNELDGIIGWLTLYGFYRIEEREALEKVKENASEMVKKEIEAFLKNRAQAKNRYIAILEALSQGAKSWKEIKTYLTIKEGKRIPDIRLATYLKTLRNYGFIEKKGGYRLTDPLIKEALR